MYKDILDKHDTWGMKKKHTHTKKTPKNNDLFIKKMIIYLNLILHIYNIQLYNNQSI